MPPLFWGMLLMQMRSLSNVPSLSFSYSLASNGGSGTQVVHLRLCDPLWALHLCLEPGVLLGPLSLSLFVLSFPLCRVLSLRTFARVSLMTFVYMYIDRLKTKNLGILKSGRASLDGLPWVLGRGTWEHGSHFPMLGKRQSLLHLPFHYR